MMPQTLTVGAAAAAAAPASSGSLRRGLGLPHMYNPQRPAPGEAGLRPGRIMMCRASARPSSGGAKPARYPREPRSASPPRRAGGGRTGASPAGPMRSAAPYRDAVRRQQRQTEVEEARQQVAQLTGEAKVAVGAVTPSEDSPFSLLRRGWERFLADPSEHPLHLASIVCVSGYIMASAVSLSEYINDVEIAILPAMSAGFVVGGLYATLLRYANVRVWRTPRKSKTVVITGSAQGIGKAMAREFLLQGDKVIITSRSERTVASAVKELREEVGGKCVVYGVSCEVTSPSSVARLVSMSQSLLGDIDVWINNAANSGSYKSFLEFSDQQMASVVRTNLLGSLYCMKAAFQAMKGQRGGGHIFNMDGAGADGMPTPYYAAYGSTKAAIGHLKASLQEEAKAEKLDIGVHTCSPGMVLTNLLLEGATLSNLQVFNILCEHPETAAGFLVPRIRSAVALNKRGEYIAYLTPVRIIGRFLLAPFRQGRFFDTKGKPGYLSEYERILGKGSEDTERALDWVRRRDHALIISYSFSMAFAHAAFVYDALAAAGKA
mmetsp:Transcript_10474/g.29783  ORF Transcript_10474/g.29783 Transcript_10474/m.29783 type:complete len:549 (-) Transcript_10474:166-1812(-)